MVWLRGVWAGVRDTVFVAAQVVTLGVLAMVLGLIALNVLTHRPPARPGVGSQPSRPLTSLVPTLVPDTPTPLATSGPASPTALPLPPTPTARVDDVGQPGRVGDAPAAQPGPASPAAPPPGGGPATPPTPAGPAPAGPPTPGPAEPTATSAVAGRLMKVLPAADGLPARVRAEPHARATILVRVPLGSTVEVIGAANGDELQPGNPKWLKVRWKGTTGYVYSALVGDQ